jgi:hypothetical protein
MRSNASVPQQPVHPDHDQLAAWQAGALAEPAGARVGAHLAGCAECAAVVSVVEAGRTALASLEEPELPPGLHERLAAAVEREQAAPARLRTARSPRRRRRPRAWSGRVAVLGAAAALILLVAGLIPVLRNAGGDGTQSSGGATASGSAAAPSAGALPTFTVPGEYSAGQLRAAVASSPAVRDAYRRAAGSSLSSAGRSAQPANPSTATDSRGAGGLEASPNARSQSTQSEGPATASGSAAPAVDQQACLAQVRVKTSAAVVPAFFVDTTYRGRAATVLVTRRAGVPGQAELWAFPRGNCRVAPFASEQVQIPSP